MKCTKYCKCVHNNEMFFCSICQVQYCFYCLDCYYRNSKDKYIQFSSKNAEPDSEEFGYNYRKPQTTLYCEDCIQYITKLNEAEKFQVYANELNFVQNQIQGILRRVRSKYDKLNGLR